MCLCILWCISSENIAASNHACCVLDLMPKTAVSSFTFEDDDDDDNDVPAYDGKCDGDGDFLKPSNIEEVNYEDDGGLPSKCHHEIFHGT